jgi:hypothetical protein
MLSSKLIAAAATNHWFHYEDYKELHTPWPIHLYTPIVGAML